MDRREKIEKNDSWLFYDKYCPAIAAYWKIQRPTTTAVVVVSKSPRPTTTALPKAIE